MVANISGVLPRLASMVVQPDASKYYDPGPSIVFIFGPLHIVLKISVARQASRRKLTRSNFSSRLTLWLGLIVCIPSLLLKCYRTYWRAGMSQRILWLNWQLSFAHFAIDLGFDEEQRILLQVPWPISLSALTTADFECIFKSPRFMSFSNPFRF